MGSPLHRLTPWLRRPVRTCLRSIPISLPWQQGLLYPICTRLMARQGGRGKCAMGLVADVLFGHDFGCWWWWLSHRADQYFLFQKDHAHPDMSVTSRRRHLQHIDQDSFFRASFHLRLLSLSLELAKKHLFFLGKVSTQDAFQGTLPTRSTKPARFSSATPILRDDLLACFHRSEGVSSWSDITGGNH